VEGLVNTASSFVCLLNIIDGHVNLTLGPEMHNGHIKIGDAANDKNKRRGWTLRSYFMHTQIHSRSRRRRLRAHPLLLGDLAALRAPLKEPRGADPDPLSPRLGTFPSGNGSIDFVRSMLPSASRHARWRRSLRARSRMVILPGGAGSAPSAACILVTGTAGLPVPAVCNGSSGSVVVAFFLVNALRRLRAWSLVSPAGTRRRGKRAAVRLMARPLRTCLTGFLPSVLVANASSSAMVKPAFLPSVSAS
jgi:hypothetical protein